MNRFDDADEATQMLYLQMAYDDLYEEGLIPPRLQMETKKFGIITSLLWTQLKECIVLIISFMKNPRNN